MTSVWGPLGWMTLHSISINYPENPDTNEKLICSKFIEFFGDCITCHICKTHFIKLYQIYKTRHPEYLNSRYDLFLFIVRLHNTVNKKLDKPIIKSVNEALQTLKQATTQTNPSTFRKKYLDYLKRIWNTDTSSSGLFAKHKIIEMEKINNEYWNLRENTYDIKLDEANVLEFIEDVKTQKFNPYNYSSKVGFRNGRLMF